MAKSTSFVHQRFHVFKHDDYVAESSRSILCGRLLLHNGSLDLNGCNKLILDIEVRAVSKNVTQREIILV